MIDFFFFKFGTIFLVVTILLLIIVIDNVIEIDNNFTCISISFVKEFFEVMRF